MPPPLHAPAGDQFSISLIYLRACFTAAVTGWGSVLNIPDILVEEVLRLEEVLGISSQYP